MCWVAMALDAKAKRHSAFALTALSAGLGDLVAPRLCGSARAFGLRLAKGL